eukprot:2261004-Prymnesium_polylepis.1
MARVGAHVLRFEGGPGSLEKSGLRDRLGRAQHAHLVARVEVGDEAQPKLLGVPVGVGKEPGGDDEGDEGSGSRRHNARPIR